MVQLVYKPTMEVDQSFSRGQ